MKDQNNCCQLNKREGVFKGFLFGLIPHAFCIGFILFSFLGSAIFVARFKYFLLSPYFFYILIAVSFLFATIAAIIYLRKVKCLCFMGLKSKWRYLTILYSTTILANLLINFIVFPALANVNYRNEAVNQEELTELSMSVNIPCSGHAFLIIDELEKDNGIRFINFKMPNVFTIKYDSGYTSPDKIVSMDIFKSFEAKIVN